MIKEPVPAHHPRQEWESLWHLHMVTFCEDDLCLFFYNLFVFCVLYRGIQRDKYFCSFFHNLLHKLLRLNLFQCVAVSRVRQAPGPLLLILKWIYENCFVSRAAPCGEFYWVNLWSFDRVLWGTNNRGVATLFDLLTLVEILLFLQDVVCDSSKIILGFSLDISIKSWLLLTVIPRVIPWPNPRTLSPSLDSLFHL